ncbi:MAG: class I mannose-6-phosphate isomerase [Verrucomicrobiae bacterium]|nr:class I mannose-6-phosphate isomerase [Verrucomicrobiae bacterium]
MSLYPLTFFPRFKERVWGGRRLADLFHKPLPPDVPIGESWEISDRPGDASVIRNGPLAGRDLRWLMEQHGSELLGSPVAAGQRFPWLVKLLDASEDLSLQVHPPAHRAAELQGEPKSEMWYFADAAAGSRIFAGLRAGVTRDAFAGCVADGTVADCLHTLSPQAGDAIFLPSGRVHALGAGTVVFEFQQNSDTTYRVFDWNRRGLDGRPRELHLDASLRSIDFDDLAPALAEVAWEGTRRPLVRNAVFHLDEWRFATASTLGDPRRPGACAVLAVVSGAAQCRHPSGTVDLGPGDFVLLSAVMDAPIVDAEGGTTLLRMLPAPAPS